MLTHPTVDQLVKLGLAGMARAFTELQDNPSAAGLGHAEWLAVLLEREATERSNRRLTARLRHARLRQHATIEDIDWRAQRGLDRSLFQRLIAGDWITAPHNLIIEGPPASANPGSPAHSATRLVATTTPSSTSVSQSCSPTSPSPAVTDAIRG